MDDLSVDYKSSSRRPSTSQSKLDNTMTSNFTMETVDIDELKQQLAQSSFELSEQKSQFKKQMAKQQKEIELGYEQIEA